VKVCLVCSHGGHLTELLQLAPAWTGHETFFITYRSPRRTPARAYEYANLTARPLSVVPMFVQVLRVLARERPDWVVSDGAELAIPVFVAAKLLRLRTMFIESLCRVESPSFTGRLVYPLSDVFFVQWPSLLRSYGPKARYAGKVI